MTEPVDVTKYRKDAWIKGELYVISNPFKESDMIIAKACDNRMMSIFSCDGGGYVKHDRIRSCIRLRLAEAVPLPGHELVEQARVDGGE